jgi:predicted acyl esterase
MLRTARVPLALAVVALVSMLGAAAADAAMDARGSVEQVYATGLEAGAQASLLDSAGRALRTKPATAEGGILFRGVKPGSGYRVRVKGGETSDALTVLTKRSAPPSTDLYDQEIPSNGYGYLTTRDGIKLSYYVHPPQDVSGATPLGYAPATPGQPTPTLVEYSGYGYANPAGPQSGISIIANIFGFTVIDVNMRGTGCSGGAFDFFEPLQNLDGYDIIETVARQPWVSHNKVGMMGISYGGISQLFTAQTQPPSLAAITPISLIDQTQTTLYPGGILNTGFAFAWAKQRAEEARPAGPDDDQGQRWAYQKIQEGDGVCKDNQALHGQAADLIGKVRQNNTYVPKVADPLSPITFVDKIKVPTFLACQWQDEQTGGHCPTLPSRLTGTDKKWSTFTNGTHIDSLDPETFNRWYDFLQLYVAREAPIMDSAAIRAAAPVLYQAAMGIDGVTLPPDPIQEQPTYEGALAAFEAQDPIRILFDNGAGGEPGHPYPGFEKSFERLPVPGTKGRTWFFSGKGALSARKPVKAGANSFKWNARARTLTNFTGDTAAGENGLWTATPPYPWQQHPAGTALSYLTDPLEESAAVVGKGYVRAWVKSSRPTVDLQATITEVRPDDKETFVQGGWLRGEMRKLDARKSTPLEPVLSLRKKHVRPMPRGRFVKVTIPLYYQGHAYRAGSRIRVTISAPNGDQPIWAFAETKPKGKAKAKVAIAYSKRMPSNLTLPVVPGVEVPTELPPCPSLRAQPCREYERVVNR